MSERKVISQGSELLPKITIEEVKRTLKKMRNSKAPEMTN